ncbi:MAG TPA: class I SAM-dependent methyltransferase [Gemmatimonadaceae bacterium]|nr:class I SAM-dependent methyltransferase [Gemmatimonadaceae bacterium]
MPIEHISDTARWVAFYRAMETERGDAIFHDPFARRLAGPRGEEIVRTIPRGRSTAWAMIVRTAVFDEIIASVTARGVDTVINLAAGLDARPWRLALPQSLHWIDVDLPAILHYKTETLAQETPRCRYEAITADLTDDAARRALFERLGAGAKRSLILSEGLLIYLAADQVGALARDLHAQPGFAWWLIDLASPWLLQYMNRSWGRQVAAGNAPFQFAPAESTAFFEPFGWREAEFRSSIDEARRLHRDMPLGWLWRFLSRLGPKARQEEMRRMSGIVLLERV